MTTEQKNIAIAKMLGWEICTEEFQLKWFACSKKGLSKLAQEYIPICTKDVHVMFADDKRFLEDANHQFEALLFINRLGYEWELASYLLNNKRFWCAINELVDENSNSLNTVILPQEGDTPKEAVFEALYQFSQYLKQK